MVTDKKWEELRNQLKENNILEKDIEEKFVLVGGKGGQKANKSAVAVQLKYSPLNIVIKSTKTRSREDNRFFARRALLEKILNSTNTNTIRDEKLEKIRKNKARKQAKSKAKHSQKEE